MYKNSIDCARKIFRNEGILGFYRGLGPQLVVCISFFALFAVLKTVVRALHPRKPSNSLSMIWFEPRPWIPKRAI